MSTAEELAMALSYEFLRNGNYSAAVGPLEVPGIARMIPAAAHAEHIFAESEGVFASLAVQAVGFEEGIDNPKVHIYLTRASRKLLKSIPNEIDGVPVRAHKMGPITVRPEAAASATARGHLFERNNRICCGSSCAPTSENYSGTFGAIVRSKTRHRNICYQTIMSFLAATTFRLLSRSSRRAIMIVARTLEHLLKSGDISKLTRCGAVIQIS